MGKLVFNKFGKYLPQCQRMANSDTILDFGTVKVFPYRKTVFFCIDEYGLINQYGKPMTFKDPEERLRGCENFRIVVENGLLKQIDRLLVKYDANDRVVAVGCIEIFYADYFMYDVPKGYVRQIGSVDGEHWKYDPNKSNDERRYYVYRHLRKISLGWTTAPDMICVI